MRHAAAKAFSLLELFVAIAIIAVLLGILLPTIFYVRCASKITVCASNLRQIGQTRFSPIGLKIGRGH